MNPNVLFGLVASRLLILLTVIGSALLCAPVWWWTTRVYRANIKYDVLESLSLNQKARTV
jgi:hypothetical protein